MQVQNFGSPGAAAAAAVMSQVQTASATPGGGAPSQPRQRVRARRGQATDPHSIAERVKHKIHTHVFLFFLVNLVLRFLQNLVLIIDRNLAVTTGENSGEDEGSARTRPECQQSKRFTYKLLIN